ncbi:MAG: hypothetical protein KKF62_13495 [Bacteroidetes bacterium]|nr:hypothetical protein [Bacteroidota bacterium]MBU1115530.1 hypothetical protein [Bacteroidota bacterium]MBU1799582.1 hypothetical protein [Bacteroidota bacterium]
MEIKLFQLDKELKTFLTTFIVVLTIGVSIGLVYLKYTTKMTPKGTVERYNGSNDNEFDIAESYPKPISEMLTTTHSHVIIFAIIFVAIGFIFNFNSIINGFWKQFLIIEPLISTIITFSSIWGIRYIHKSFVYITIISAVLMYVSYYIMSLISFYELVFKKNGKE